MNTTFWSRNKVFITGLIGALIMGLLPVLAPTSESVTIVALVMAATTATASYFAKELRGKAQSIAGILFSTATMVIPVLFAHGQIDWKSLSYMVLVQIAAQFYGFSAPPIKPSSYEHNEAIVEAKKVPPVDQVPLPENQK